MREMIQHHFSRISEPLPKNRLASLEHISITWRMELSFSTMRIPYA